MSYVRFNDLGGKVFNVLTMGNLKKKKQQIFSHSGELM